MEDITINMAQLVSIAGGITAIAACWKLLSKPYNELKDRVTSLEKKTVSHDGIFERDKKQLDKIDELLDDSKQANQLTQKMLFLILNHSIDGNGVQEMKKLRDQLIDNEHFMK